MPFQGFPDNSAQDNSARTIRRDNLSRTIRRKVYIINFIENPASTQQYSFHQSRFHFSNFFINLASISAILFHLFLTLTYIVYLYWLHVVRTGLGNVWHNEQNVEVEQT